MKHQYRNRGILFLTALLLWSAPTLASAYSVTLGVLNPANASGQVVVAVGDAVTVEYTVADPDAELSDQDRIDLVRLSDGVTVSSVMRGSQVVGTVSLNVTATRGIGNLVVRYVHRNNATRTDTVITEAPDLLAGLPILGVADPFTVDLMARVGALESQVSALQGALTAETAARIAAENTLLGGLDDQAAQLADLAGNNVPGLSSYLAVDTSDPLRPSVRVAGANLQVVNGMGTTKSINGVGNLIIGYDEARTAGDPLCSRDAWNNQVDCEAHGGTWGLNHKGGSHNLVGGLGNAYSSYGGVVFGESNGITAAHAAVHGGVSNIATAPYANVSTGNANRALGYMGSVTGGRKNTASGYAASVNGGENNTASGQWAAVSGGQSRTAGIDHEWADGTVIAALRGDVTAAQAGISDNSGAIGSNSVAIGDLDVSVNGAGGIGARLTGAEGDIGTLLTIVAALDIANLTNLASRLDALEPDVVPGMGSYLEVDESDPSRPTVRVTGANLQVVNGMGRTYDINGVGNLIVGYDEGPVKPEPFFCSEGSIYNQVDCEASGYTWAGAQKTGSHNLVVGSENSYTAAGGVVFGVHNVVNGDFASVTGGWRNFAGGYTSTVSGGLNRAENDSYQLAGDVPGLGSYLEVDESDPSRPTVWVTGANLQVVNGLNSTDTVNGVGNLIIGYNEARTSGAPSCSIPYESITQVECESVGGTWALNHKSGSHNLVGGTQNNYSSYGGMAFGHSNSIMDRYATVSGGAVNTASGYYSSVSGGHENTASGNYSSVSGGTRNAASNFESSVSGGVLNTASGPFSSVSGGARNTANWDASSVSGGLENNAGSHYTSVSGGYQRSVITRYDWAAGALLEEEPTAPDTTLPWQP